MVCGPLLRALLPTDGEALLYGKRQKNNLMPHQFNVTMIADRPLAQLLSARSRCGRSGVRFPDRSNRHSVANGSPPLRSFFGAV